MRKGVLTGLPWPPAASGGLQGSESCMLPSESSRAVDAEALQAQRISSPAELGECSLLRPCMQGTHCYCQPFNPLLSWVWASGQQLPRALQRYRMHMF